MFARISNRFVPLLLVLPLLAVASAVPRTDINQCNTGIECCKSTEAAGSTSPSTNSLLSNLGVVVGDLTGLVGLGCSPIISIKGFGDFCNGEPVCCTSNSFSGLINLGCAPININL